MASVNIFGGFLVTSRMLAMYKKKDGKEVRTGMDLAQLPCRPAISAFHIAMSPNIAAILYLVAGVLFILALRGLSHPETSRDGNRFGMLGMTIAVLTTLALLSAPARCRGF